jgi:hypothetical protein
MLLWSISLQNTINKFFFVTLNQLIMKSACKNRCLATILLAICLIVGTPLWAQQKVVHGVVEDLEGNPILVFQ